LWNLRILVFGITRNYRASAKDVRSEKWNAGTGSSSRVNARYLSQMLPEKLKAALPRDVGA
jgi:hypothetical protein